MSFLNPNSEKRTIAFQGDNAYGRYTAANPNQGFDWRTAAPVAGMAAIPALSAIFAGAGAGAGGAAGAASVPGAAGASAAPLGVGGVSAGTGATGGIMARLGSIFGSKGFETGANGFLALKGMQSQNKANAQGRADVLAQQAKEIELAQAQLAAQTRDQDLNRADAKALNDAMQKLEAQKMAIQQEQMQYERGISDKEQAYKDNYRSTVQGPAAQRLRSILGF